MQMSIWISIRLTVKKCSSMTCRTSNASHLIVVDREITGSTLCWMWFIPEEGGFRGRRKHAKLKEDKRPGTLLGNKKAATTYIEVI